MNGFCDAKGSLLDTGHLNEIHIYICDEYTRRLDSEEETRRLWGLMWTAGKLEAGCSNPSARK